MLWRFFCESHPADVAVNVSGDQFALTLFVSLIDVGEEQRPALTLRLRRVRRPTRAPSLAAARVLRHTGLFDPVAPREVRQRAEEARSFKGDALGIPQNRTASESEWARVRERSEGKQEEEEGTQDHMLFLLAEKQDDLIRSSAKFYTSETKLLPAERRFTFVPLSIYFWCQASDRSWTAPPRVSAKLRD